MTASSRAVQTPSQYADGGEERYTTVGGGAGAYTTGGDGAYTTGGDGEYTTGGDGG